jgi:hypothetical protein
MREWQRRLTAADGTVASASAMCGGQRDLHLRGGDVVSDGFTYDPGLDNQGRATHVVA